LSFLFQAEDGIRDRNVTGVQTCALPILSSTPASGRPGKPAPLVDRPDECIGHNAGIPLWAFGGILTRCVVKVEAGAILSCHAFRRSVCRRPTVPHTLSSDDVAERRAR